MQYIKSLVVLSVFFTCFAQAQPCDESCKRDQLKNQQNLDFPGYLSWKYCEGLRNDFMTIDMRSLQSYSSKHFDTRYKGPIKNIVKMLDQRQDWLGECDNYMKLTKKERIFKDKKSTEAIFAKMGSVKKELEAVINGARYSSENGDETGVIINEKFEALFTAVDDHNNLMNLRGRYVYQ
ncbi:hypothetical protein [Agaribacterium haliotis]|uniref:hypothetical protein n=1 Tax=Agaribacterium haliotis TaxID=2013869 RepID=UPI000BB53F44|nr:hypothetical protein [Agaribacterium haliotis]